MKEKIKRYTDELHLLYAKLFLLISLVFIFLTYGIRIEKYAHGTAPLTFVIVLLDMIRGINREPAIWSIPMYAIEWRAFGNFVILLFGIFSLCCFYEFPKAKKEYGPKVFIIGLVIISYLSSILLNKLFFY